MYTILQVLVSKHSLTKRMLQQYLGSRIEQIASERSQFRRAGIQLAELTKVKYMNFAL
jgi:hypothetical protein